MADLGIAVDVLIIALTAALGGLLLGIMFVLLYAAHKYDKARKDETLRQGLAPDYERDLVTKLRKGGAL